METRDDIGLAPTRKVERRVAVVDRDRGSGWRVRQAAGGYFSAAGEADRVAIASRAGAGAIRGATGQQRGSEAGDSVWAGSWGNAVRQAPDPVDADALRGLHRWKEPAVRGGQ